VAQHDNLLVLAANMGDLRTLREELLLFVVRWQPEVGNSTARPTLQYGIAQKCYTLIDRILAVCTAEAVTLTGRSGEEACRICCDGKPPLRMTLGERVQVLEKLDRELARVLPQIAGKRSLGKAGIGLLHSISKSRNQFIHDGVDMDEHQVAESLRQAAEFCKLNLLSMMLYSCTSLKKRRQPPRTLEAVTKLPMQSTRWNKALQQRSNQPRSGGFVVSQRREPLVRWEIAPSRVAASLVS